VAQSVRVVLALGLYLGGGALHLVLVLRGEMELYHAFANAPLLPVYGQLWSWLVEPSLPWIVLPVVAFEWLAGVAMLGRGRVARHGQLAGLAWNLALAPFGPWGWSNLVLAAVHAWLARSPFPTAAWAWRREGPRPS
jgi:hypothetical protein